MYYEKLKYFAQKDGEVYVDTSSSVLCYGVQFYENGHLYFYNDSNYITFETEISNYLLTQNDEAFKYDEGFIHTDNEDLFYLIMGYIHRYRPSSFNDVIDYKPVLMR